MIPLNLYGKTKQQFLALIGDACAQVVRHAEQTLNFLSLKTLTSKGKNNPCQKPVPLHNLANSPLFPIRPSLSI
jgi:hypothetical protein